MKSINIGRGPENDVVIDNPKVSRNHCRIFARGNEYYLVDLRSMNGTFVNGQRIRGEHRLRDNDKVTIGSERIPWQSYVNRYIAGTGSSSQSPARREHNDMYCGDSMEYDPIDSYENGFRASSSGNTDTRPNGLGLVALLLSIAGAALVIFAAVKIMKWSGFALLGNASTYILVSVLCNVAAWIFAMIANANDYKDSHLADIAEYIASTFIFIVVAFFIYIKFIDQDVLNPFRGLF